MRFEITPLDGLVDDELTVRVVECAARGRVTVTAEAHDADGRLWRSHAQFLAGEDGSFDLTKEPPILGSYTSLDPMGLVTTMSPTGKEPASIFATDDAADLSITLRAEERDSDAVATVIRRFVSPGVRVEDVEQDVVKGRLYLPDGDDQRPAVMVLPGEIAPRVQARPIAAMLASHGYVTFVVDYRHESTFAGGISDVPLETFSQAVDWLRAHPRVDTARIGGYGMERGAEGLLAAAAHLPELDLRALVAVAPSCVVWQGSASSKTPPVTSWSAEGQPLPYVPVRRGRGQKLLRSLTKREGGAVAHRAAHEDALHDAGAFKRATVPVEKIPAPILLLAGFDDQQWPSGEMAELIYKARRASHCNTGDQKLTYPKAGRVIRFPYLPAAVTRYLDTEHGGGLVLGGTPEDNHHADKACWAKTLEFLSLNLGSVTPPEAPAPPASRTPPAPSASPPAPSTPPPSTSSPPAGPPPEPAPRPPGAPPSATPPDEAPPEPAPPPPGAPPSATPPDES